MIVSQSRSRGGVYHYDGVNKDNGSGERLVDADLEPEINNLINQVSRWVEH